MSREILKKLYHNLRIFRQRSKNKHVFNRKDDLIQIMFVCDAGKFAVTDLMPANEMLRWFQGYFCCGS